MIGINFNQNSNLFLLLRYLKDFAKRSLLFGMRPAKYMDNKRG